MKLHCPVCQLELRAADGHLVCPHSSREHAHPLHKSFEASDAVLFEDVWAERWNAGENAYSIFRECLGSYALAKQTGHENEWLSFLQNLENNAKKTHPAGFEPTPLVNTARLAKQLGHRGGLFAKNETATILGSHKARHAVASLLYLETIRTIQQKQDRAPLAIFSCGNAALGAAAIARAANYPLFTFVPATLSHEVESLLSNMNAFVVKVKREGAVGQGDPCHNLYQKSLHELGFTAFSCYGHDLWPSVEGAEILALELVVQIALEQTPPEHVARYGFQKTKIDSLIVQVGGGGLANGVVAGLRKALRLQMLEHLPRIFLAQTASCFPLEESYFAVVRRIAHEAKLTNVATLELLDATPALALVREHSPLLQRVAAAIAQSFSKDSVQQVLAHVAANRSEFFKPWSANEPHSIAEGILDDTTYDGFEILVAMLETGGLPVVLTEDELQRGWNMGAECTKLNVSPTGTAALAALMVLQNNALIKSTENTAFLFTGVHSRNAPSQIKAENVVTLSPTDTEKFAALPHLFSPPKG